METPGKEEAANGPENPQTRFASPEDAEGYTKHIRMRDGGGYRKTDSFADSKGSAGEKGSETSNTDNASSVQTESNEILLGHIFKLTDEDGDLMESQLSDGYYSKKELSILAPLVKSDIEQIKINRKKMGDNDEVTKWHTATPPRILGQGTFGRVLEAIDDTSGEIIAVKETTRSRASRSKSIQALQQEMSMLKLLRHQNIVEYRGVQAATSSTSDKAGEEVLLFLMEYCPNGSISDVLEEFGALGDDVTRKYTSQILCGLDYLHRLCVAHRDIKCANCLLSVGGVVKLADFGSSKHLADCGNSIQGTALYMAPEVIKGGRTGRQADIWAVGCCVVEMLGNSMPLEGKFSNDFALMYRISKTKVSPKAPDDIAPDAKDFVEQCFTIVPENRPSAFNLFSNHPYVAKMYPDSLSTPYTPMTDFAKSYLDRHDSAKWSDGSDNQGLELGASARSHNDRLKREINKVSWSRANKEVAKDSSMDDVSNGSSSENRRLGEALLQRKEATVDRPGGEPTNTLETKVVNLHFEDDTHETWKGVRNPEEKKKKGEPLKETVPIVGSATEGNIGRLQTRTGFLFNRFEDENVENDYLVYFKRRALAFMSERKALVPCLVFGVYLATFLLRTDVSKAESVAVTLKIISWTMLASFQVLPLIDGEDTFDTFTWVVFLYKCVSLITAWDHDLFYHAFEIAVVSGLSGYFSMLMHHIVWLFLYLCILGFNFAHNLALDAIIARDKELGARIAASNSSRYGPRLDIIEATPVSTIYDAVHHYLVYEDRKELWIYIALAIISIILVFQMHHEARMKYALGFHVRHL